MEGHFFARAAESTVLVVQVETQHIVTKTVYCKILFSPSCCTDAAGYAVVMMNYALQVEQDHIVEKDNTRGFPGARRHCLLPVGPG